MYFVLAKTVGFFALPTNIIACTALIGLILLAFRRAGGKSLSISALIAFVIASFSPLGNMLITPLEQRFPAFNLPDRTINGIIVLGGSYDTHTRGAFSTLVLNDDTEPLALMARLAARYPEAKVVFSGGGTVPAADGIVFPSEAEAARRLFVTFGIPESRIAIEDRSRNTVENARFTAALLKPAPGSSWLIVTAAHHMPRAIGAFRAAGFPDAAGVPAGWRTHGWRDFYWPAPSVTENLRRVDVATREWVAMLVYWAFGYSRGLFPAP